MCSDMSPRLLLMVLRSGTDNGPDDLTLPVFRYDHRTLVVAVGGFKLHRKRISSVAATRAAESDRGAA
jgi:hypothetical protein